MEDILLMQFLKKKGIISDSDIHEFHELASISTDKEIYSAKTEKPIIQEEDSIDEEKAKSIVAKMYHCSDGKKYIGERFDISTAKEICEKYKRLSKYTMTYTDVYIAINCQYHSYYELFKLWFSNNIESKIIESAIIYWFRDDDFIGNKVHTYFMDK